MGGDLRDRFNLPAEKANPIRLRRLRTRLREVDSGADQRLNGEVMARARAAPSHCVRPDECGRLRAAARCGMELRILCRRQRVTVRPVLIASRGRRHSSCSIPVAPPSTPDREAACVSRKLHERTRGGSGGTVPSRVLRNRLRVDSNLSLNTGRTADPGLLRAVLRKSAYAAAAPAPAAGIVSGCPGELGEDSIRRGASGRATTVCHAARAIMRRPDAYGRCP